MDLARPYRAVSPSLGGAVLVALARTTTPLTGRQVAELSPEGSQKGVQNALDALVAQGLVFRRSAGSAYLYTLNRDHVAMPAVTAMADLREALLGRLRQAIGAWPSPPIHASLFGSAARGDGDTDSDIDLLVIRPRDIERDEPSWLEQLDQLARSVLAWTGNRASIKELGPDELERMRDEGAPIFGSWRQEAVALFGPEFGQVLDMSPLSLDFR